MIKPRMDNLSPDELKEIIEFVKPEDIPKADKALSYEEKQAADKINRKVASGQSLEEIMDFLFRETGELCPCDRLGLAFLEENGGRAVSYLNRSRFEQVYLKKDFWQEMGESTLKTVLQKGCPRIIHDLEEYNHRIHESVSAYLLLLEGIQSSMTCPLLVEDRVVGFFFISSGKPRAYTRHHVYLYLEIAERLSQTVEKAYRIDQLTQANNSYMEMLGFVCHELKNPLGSIIMDGTVLTEGYLGDVPEKQKDKIQKIIAKSEYLMNLVRDYLDLAKIETGKFHADLRNDVDFVMLANDSYSILEPQFVDKNIRFNTEFLPENIRVEADPDLLRIVMTNLLGNACKYGNENGKVKLKVKLENGELRVSVWNEGPGFPVEQKQRLFRKFSRIKTPELMQRKGTGVGLYTVWRIIQAHHGAITANSEPGKWAEFTFTIPQPVLKNG